MKPAKGRDDAAAGVLVILGFAAAFALVAVQVIAWFR